MAHIRIQRFRPRHAEEHAAQYKKARDAAVQQIGNPIDRIERASTPGCATMPRMPSAAIDSEPEKHDGPERAADLRRALPLHEKQREQDQHDPGST